MPPIGVVTGGLDFSNKFLVSERSQPANCTLAEAAESRGAITWNYGNFITLVINFIIVAFCIFLVVTSAEQDEASPLPTLSRCRRIARRAR